MNVQEITSFMYFRNVNSSFCDAFFYVAEYV